MAPHVLIPLAQGCEDLEAVTLIDILRRADIKVTTAGLDHLPVTGSRQTVFIPDTTIDKIMDIDFDCVVLPGGLPGSDNLNNDPRIHQILKKMATKNKYVAAICAAPKVLASAGLLDNRQATSFPHVLAQQNNPLIKISDKAVVVDGNVITSQSAGTAMDFALELVGLLSGKEKQHEINQQLVRKQC